MRHIKILNFNINFIIYLQKLFIICYNDTKE